MSVCIWYSISGGMKLTTGNWVVLLCIVLYCTELCCIVLCCAVLHCVCNASMCTCGKKTIARV